MDRARHDEARRAYHNRNIATVTVHNGKITSVREYTDTQHVGHVLFG